MRRLRGTLLALFGVAVAAYAGVVAYMYVNQRSLQYSATGRVVPLAEAGLSGVEAAVIAVGEDAVLNGWYAPPAEGMPLILYYKGNSGSFSGEHARFRRWMADGYGFLAFDYRGFPASPGEISQDNILADARAAYLWAKDKGFPIVIWGRSLGSGPASYVASVEEAGALLLETPFLSAVTVAGERYPFLPVGLVMLDQFPVNQWIAEVAEPVFIAHGTADTTIGVSNGERLYALVPNAAGLWIVENGEHGNLWELGIWDRASAFFTAALQ